MTLPLRRITNIVVAFVMAVFSINIIGAMNVYAAGNNGTLKVHELGTAPNTESNDPKVCAFNFEGFGFDAGQDGYIVLATQPGGVDTLTIPFGPASASGYAETAYVNNGGLTIPDGQYKSTLYGKDTNNPNLPGVDLKAKSKVFKVDCAKTVTPTMPTTNDICGSGNDTYTIPNITGVQYKIGELDWSLSKGWHYDWSNISAGTHTGSGSVKIKAEAKNGYLLAGDDESYEWTLTFASGDCTVTPTAPTHVELCGTVNDTYTIPATPGVTYKIKSGNSWVTKVAGTYAGSGTVIIKAYANSGYDLTGNDNSYEWSFAFSNTACLIAVTPAAPSMNDVCGKANDTYTINPTTGVTYKIGSSTKTGTYQTNSDVTITAYANSGYVLTGQTSWTLDYSQQNCPVTATAPTMVELCGTASDTYTIPAVDHVTYEKLTLHWFIFIPYYTWDVINAGTYTGSDTVKLRAVADSGYSIDGTDEWTFAFSKTACPQPCHPAEDVQIKSLNFWHDDEDEDEEEVPCIPTQTEVTVSPSATDECGVQNDTFTIVPTTGVIYKVNGVELVGAGPHSANGAASVTVTAEAAPGYTLTGQTSWTYDFTDEACPTPDLSAVAECSQTGVLVTITNDGDGDGIAYVNGDEVEVPAGESVDVTVPYTLFKADVTVYDQSEDLLLEKDFDCTPGRGNAGGPTDETPVVPTVVATVAAKTVTTTELPTTGGVNAIAQLIATLTLAAVTYGATYYFWNRRNLTSDK